MRVTLADQLAACFYSRKKIRPGTRRHFVKSSNRFGQFFSARLRHCITHNAHHERPAFRQAGRNSVKQYIASIPEGDAALKAGDNDLDKPPLGNGSRARATALALDCGLDDPVVFDQGCTHLADPGFIEPLSQWQPLQPATARVSRKGEGPLRHCASLPDNEQRLQRGLEWHIRQLFRAIRRFGHKRQSRPPQGA